MKEEAISLKMKSVLDRTPHESSFSFSRRYLNWRNKPAEEKQEDHDEQIMTHQPSSHSLAPAPPKWKLTSFRSAIAHLVRTRTRHSPALGTKVVGTLFGFRRGHVQIAFQDSFRSSPALLIQISTPTSVLVREMATGLVRVALECDKKADNKGLKLLDEPLWRAYCNGKKCGYATRRQCGEEELKVLAAVGPVTMGAGVLPGGAGGEGELMYMRAKFERVAGSKDSEALYMVNPDGNGGPELSLYFLRV